MKKKIIIALAILILLIAGGIFYGYKTNRLPKFWQKNAAPTEQVEKYIDITLEAGATKQDLAVPENSTLLEVMINARLAGVLDFIAREDTTSGLKVETINDKTADAKNNKSWVCYINNQKKTEKLFEYVVQQNDHILWKIE